MFDEVCSIYADALDNVGRYVDRETGECISEMSVREFCLTDRWRPQVERLRALRRQYGDGAKRMEEYVDTKKSLPGATLSGLFELREDECVRRDGTRFTARVSRRETHLLRHTGWLAVDIDLADNKHLSDFGNVRMACGFRPEIALLMRSCSGTGYFGLVRLAYPERHKEQFRALLKDYAAIGITLDRQCGNIGRVRFASWDTPDNIYINENAVPYKGLDGDACLIPLQSVCRRSARKDAYNNVPDSKGILYLKASRLVSKIEAMGVNIADSYDDWVKCGRALYDIDMVAGYDMWKRISRFRPSDSGHGHLEQDFSSRWFGFANSAIKAESFFWLCRQHGVALSKDEYREIYGLQ